MTPPSHGIHSTPSWANWSWLLTMLRPSGGDAAVRDGAGEADASWARSIADVGERAWFVVSSCWEASGVEEDGRGGKGRR